MSSTQSTLLNCSSRSSELSTLPCSPLGDTGILTDTFQPLLSADVHSKSVFALSCLLIITGTIGIILNILVLTTFVKMGFTETINISYFALGISDLGVLVTTAWGAICNLFVIAEVKLPFNAMEISTPTMYWPGEGFEKTTTCVTAYIALERCLCVLFPLHVKTFLTRRHTGIVMAAIFVLVIIPSNLGSLGYSFKWDFNHLWNTTILRTVDTSNPTHKSIEAFVVVYISTCVHVIALIAIWLCTVFLAIALKRNTKSTKKNFGQVNSNASETRNVRVMKTVFLIALLYINLSTPRAAANLVSFLQSGFHIRGRFYRTYMITIIVCVQLSLFNSSINIFVYIYMSTKFRATLRNSLFGASANTK